MSNKPRVICRLPKKKEFRHFPPELIFLDEPSNYGSLVCWSRIGEHSECSFRWYREDTKPANRETTLATLKQYISLYPHPEGWTVDDYEIVTRIPPQLWSRRSQP